jgi:hypothetical protein
MLLTLDRLLEIACEGTEDKLAPDERAEFDRFMRRARVRRLTAPAATELPETTANPSRPDRAPHRPILAASGSGNRRWRWVALATGVAASVALAMAVFTIGRARLAEHEAEQAAVERDAVIARIARLEAELEQQRGRPRNLPLGSEHPLRLTASKANTPADWAVTLANQYNPGFTPEENLARLEKLSVAVRVEVAKKRREKPTATAKEILDALFEAWGKPKH